MGRQLARDPSHPPNWIPTDPSADRCAVMLLSEYAFCGLAVKKPSSFYTVTDQKPSTGTSPTVSRCKVVPSFRAGFADR